MSEWLRVNADREQLTFIISRHRNVGSVWTTQTINFAVIALITLMKFLATLMHLVNFGG